MREFCCLRDREHDREAEIERPRERPRDRDKDQERARERDREHKRRMGVPETRIAEDERHKEKQVCLPCSACCESKAPERLHSAC